MADRCKRLSLENSLVIVFLNLPSHLNIFVPNNIINPVTHSLFRITLAGVITQI